MYNFVCVICKRNFEDSKHKDRKVCSQKCKSKKMAGRSLSEQTKNKISLNRIGKNCGEEHKNWQGDKVSYRKLHDWVQRYKGKADHCEECELDKIPEGKKRYFQWANISRQYKRDLLDWKQLCVKCHKQFDKI